MDTNWIKKNNFDKNFNLIKEIISLPIPYIKLNIGFPVNDFYEEAIKNQDKKIPLITAKMGENKKAKGWDGILVSGNPEHNLITTELFPKITKWFLNCDLFEISNVKEVRFNIQFLAPGAQVPLHRDAETHFLGGLNFAITQPKNCNFIVEDMGRIPFEKAGDVFLCQIGQRHTVINEGEETRIHLLSKTKKNYQQLIKRFII